ncbi:MAG: dihydroneopterin aldolase [Planctomycetota bacterium]|jgi:dihydroneopterin aldolase/D-erythro-7,8-dihydroneopterin triphosphate epimerase
MTANIDQLDRIHIRDLNLRCIIGVYEEERREKQDVAINITMYVDLRSAGKTDNIEDTVDYKAIKKSIITMVEKSACFLVEHLAELVAQICLQDKRIKRAVVTVDKPGALRFARSVAVEIVRDQQKNG